ncbi:MAG: hypothetical protein RLZZ501_1178 [Pseudomonadota bacterium]
MPIYMKFPGADGNVSAQGFDKWIELTSVGFGMDRPMDSQVGNKSYGATAKLKIHDITATKVTDGSSPQLTIAALQGAFDKTVTIAFATTTTSGMENFMSYELQNCGVSSMQTHGGQEGKPMETYTLRFSQIQFTFSNMAQDGTTTPTITGYNLETAQSL